MRIVLDTNVHISALLVPHGTCGKVLRLLERPNTVLLTSQPLLDELKEKLIKKIGYRRIDAEEVVQEIEGIAEKVFPLILIEAIQKDPPDNRILECAVDGNADAIVTGDKKHLLPLENYNGIPILSPAEFLGRFFPENRPKNESK